MEIQHTLSGDRVVRRMLFLNPKGEELDVVHLIPNSSHVLRYQTAASAKFIPATSALRMT